MEIMQRLRSSFGVCLGYITHMHEPNLAGLDNMSGLGGVTDTLTVTHKHTTNPSNG